MTEQKILNQNEVIPRTIKPRHIETVFGNMHGHNISQTVAVAATDTFYEVTAGLTEDESDGVEFVTNHAIKTRYGGLFLIISHISANTTTANDEIEGAVMVNGVAQDSGSSHGTISKANGDICLSGCLMKSLSSGDELSLAVANHVAVRDIVVTHAGICAVRIG